LVVALLFLGPDKLPEAAKTISKGIRDLKKQSKTLQQTIENDERIGGAIRDIKSALRGDEEPVRPKPFRPKPQLTAPTESLADKPGEPDWDAEHPPPKAEAPPEAEAKRGVKLSAPAGEADADHPVNHDDDDELGAMIKPAAGTVAKGETKATEPETKHG